MKSLRYFSRRANKEMLDQKADNTKTSNQIDICVASSSKQEDRAKNQELKRPIQIEEITGQSDPLNVVFCHFDSKFQNIQKLL